MNTDQLTNPIVKAAFTAWKAADAPAWLACLAPNATLFDDGKPHDFRQFSTATIGHERFTSIDRVADEGRSIYGRFHSEQWGDFDTYFRFHLNADGKITRLDIGQAD